MVGDQWAVPTHELVARLGTLIECNETATLVTVLDVEGSAYRRAGSKMVITADGSQIGSVTAGCLEAKFLEIADSVMETERARVETFDLTGEDDRWGLGVGCNGVITFLFEPLTDAYEPVSAAIAVEEPMALVAAFDDAEQMTARGVYTERDGFVPVSGEMPASVIESVQPHLRDAVEDGSTQCQEVATGSVFIDGIAAPPRLLLLGHGNDVGPVVDIGQKAGFRVDVVSFRGASTADERFADAHSVQTLSPTAVGAELPLDSETYVVIMSHNFVDDTLAFQSVLDSPVPYIGLLGPAERFEEMTENIDEEIDLTQADRERIYTPVGLDLGGGTPYQIAQSIVAEVLAVHNDREIGHLADRDGPIHER